MNYRHLFLIIITLIAGRSVAHAQADQKILLSVGDKAPTLTVAKWVNKKPNLPFKSGHVYMVEFGMLSCRPCMANIPHLSEIENKFSGKVTVIGVHVWENTRHDSKNLSYIARVKKVITSLGNQVQYAIGVDVPQQTTAEDWMVASGISAVPATFIIDQSGIIVWIGNPIGGDIENVLEQVVNETYHITEKNKQAVENEDISAAIARIWGDKTKGDVKSANSRMDSLIAKYPNQTMKLQYQKFRMLLNLDDQHAHNHIRWMLNKNIPEFNANMFHIGMELIDQKINPNFELVIEVLDRAIDTSTYEAVTALILDAKANAYHRKGDLKKAIEIQKQAQKLIKLFVLQSTAFKSEEGIIDSHLARYEAKIRESEIIAK